MSIFFFAASGTRENQNRAKADALTIGLERAFKKMKPERAEQLLREAPDSDHYRALYVAVEAGLLAIRLVKLFVRYGGDSCINQLNPCGATALHAAVQQDRPAILAALLIKAGARVDIHDDNGRTPLDLVKKNVTDTPDQKVHKRTLRAVLKGHCWRCDGKNAVDAEKLLNCSQCGLARYCNAECQHQHWPRHKEECREFSGKK